MDVVIRDFHKKTHVKLPDFGYIKWLLVKRKNEGKMGKLRIYKKHLKTNSVTIVPKAFRLCPCFKLVSSHLSKYEDN